MNPTSMDPSGGSDWSTSPTKPGLAGSSACSASDAAAICWAAFSWEMKKKIIHLSIHGTSSGTHIHMTISLSIFQLLLAPIYPGVHLSTCLSTCLIPPIHPSHVKLSDSISCPTIHPLSRNTPYMRAWMVRGHCTHRHNNMRPTSFAWFNATHSQEVRPVRVAHENSGGCFGLPSTEHHLGPKFAISCTAQMVKHSNLCNSTVREGLVTRTVFCIQPLTQSYILASPQVK